MEIFSLFTTIHNPKIHHKKYLFLDLVFLIMTAVISGAKTWKEIRLFGECHLEWLRQYRPFSQGIPDDHTIAQLVIALNPQMFNDIFINLLNEMRAKKGKNLIKVDRRVFHKQFKPEIQSSLHSISLWFKPQGFVVTQHKPSTMKHEKLGILEILDSLVLKNTIIAINSLNTQKKIVETLRKQKADYILPLKYSHTHFKSELAAYFHKLHRDSPRKITTFHKINDKPSVEKVYRKALVDYQWLSDVKNWKGIKSIISLTHKIENEVKDYFYLSSLSDSVEKLVQMVITHDLSHCNFSWEVDIIYRDIINRTIKSGAENLLKLYRFALKLTEYHPLKESMKNKLKKAMWSNSFRDELLMGI